MVQPVRPRVAVAPGSTTDHLVQRGREGDLGALERHAVLWSLRAGQARLDTGQVELNHVGVHWVVGLGREQPLGLRVCVDEGDLLRVPTRELEIVERHLVDRADGDRRSVLRRHIAQRRTVGQGQR